MGKPEITLHGAYAIDSRDMETRIPVLNYDEYTSSHKYMRIRMNSGPFTVVDCIVHANNLQNAIDILIDHYEGSAPGWFFTHEEADAMSDEELEGYVYGGNYCRYMSFGWHDVHADEYDKQGLWIR